MKFVEGDITEVKSGYILQQCNCVTINALGLTKYINDKYGICPYNDRKPYKGVSSKEDISVPGTVMILSREDTPNIVNMFGQYNPGHPTSIPWCRMRKAYGDNPIVHVPDTRIDREKYFQMCLDALYDFLDSMQ